MVGDGVALLQPYPLLTLSGSLVGRLPPLRPPVCLHQLGEGLLGGLHDGPSIWGLSGSLVCGTLWPWAGTALEQGALSGSRGLLLPYLLVGPQCCFCVLQLVYRFG